MTPPPDRRLAGPADAIRSHPDLAVAAALATSTLLLAIAWSSLPGADAPPLAWSAFVGVGGCGWFLLTSAARAHPHRSAELRGVLVTVTSLAAVAFLLHLDAGPNVAIREWALFTVGVLALFAAAEVAGRLVWTASIGYLLGGLALAALVMLVLARGPHGYRAAATLAEIAPLPILTAAVAGLLAALSVRLRRPPPLAMRVYAVAFPALAVFAFTRDFGAPILLGTVLSAVLLTAQATRWRPAPSDRRRRSAALGAGLSGLALVLLVAAVLSAGVAGLAVWYPSGGFAPDTAPPGWDLFGRSLTEHRVDRPAGTLSGTVSAATGEILGRPLLWLLLGIATILIVQVVLLFHRVLRSWRERREPIVVLIGAGLTAHLVVTLAGPVLAVLGADVPASLRTLPIASDGGSFMVTLIALGLLFGAGNRTGVRTAGTRTPITTRTGRTTGPSRSPRLGLR